MKTEEYLSNERKRKIPQGGGETGEMEMSNLPDKEVKETVIRMLTKLKNGIQDLKENFNEEKV